MGFAFFLFESLAVEFPALSRGKKKAQLPALRIARISRGKGKRRGKIYRLLGLY